MATTTDPTAAKRFKASSYSGTHDARVQAAISDAQAFVAAPTGTVPLLDDTGRQYALKNTTAKAANAKAGPTGLQAIAEDDVGGLWSKTAGTILTMGNNVRLEFSKDVAISKTAGISTIELLNVENKQNFTVTSIPSAFPNQRPTGSNAPHNEWSVGKAIIDMRSATPGSGSGLRSEGAVRFSGMYSTNAANGAKNFKYSDLFAICSNDCAAPGVKQGQSLFTPRGPNLANAIQNGIFIDLDFDGCYSGYGGFQLSSVSRCAFLNNRSHGGTMWRCESDGHYQNPAQPNVWANWGVDQVDFIAGYEEDGNKLITLQPNQALHFTSWYVDGIYAISCLEAGNSGQMTGAVAGRTWANSFFGEMWHHSGNHSAWQEQSPCMTNLSVTTWSPDSAVPVPGSAWGSVKFNYGHAGGPGHGLDGTGAELTWGTRGDPKYPGVRDATMTPGTLRARWSSKRITLGTGVVTVPGAPVLTGPASPQTEPYDLVVSGTVDKAADWEWRLTSNGVAGSWVADATATISDTHPFPALSFASGPGYAVHARCTNSAGTGAISSPYQITINQDSVTPPLKGVVLTGPAAATVSSSAVFTFSASGATSLQTSLDGATFATHTSPQTITALAPGVHNFRVHGTNTDGVGPNSDTYTWDVNQTADIAAVALSGTTIIDNVGKWANTDSTTLTIPFPAGIDIDDVMLLFVGWDGNGTINTPAGWTRVTSAAASTSIGFMLATRIVDGTEAATLDVTGPNTGGGSGAILNLTDVYEVQPITASTTNNSG